MLHKNAALKQNNVLLPMAFFTYNVAKQVVMTYKLLRNFSGFVSVAVKHFTRSDGINHLWSNKY